MRCKYKQSMRNFLLWLDLTIPGAFHIIYPYFSYFYIAIDFYGGCLKYYRTWEEI